MKVTLPDNEPQLIGRSSEAIVLSDQTISRRHAELTPEGDGTWYIRDLQSANGTFVNGVRVTERRKLKPGDQVRTGNTLLIYGEDVPDPLANRLKLAPASQVDVSVEHTVDANEESMIMSSPEPSQAAEFQLQIIYQLVALIGSVTDKHELLEKMMDVVFEYFAADRGFVLLTDDEDRGKPSPAVMRFREDNSLLPDPARKATISRTIVRYVLRRGVAVLSSNAMTDTRFAAGDSVQAYGIRSAICVPIKHKDQTYGVIQLDSKISNYTFTEDQLSLLAAIGVQTGLALDNARLLEKRMQEERLAATGSAVASLSHSIKNILQGMRGGSDVVELGLRKHSLDVVQKGWDIVHRNQEKIYQLTLNMLQYSKQRKPELSMEHLLPVFEDLLSLVQSQFDAKGVALITDIEPDLPPVPIEASGLHQAVLNLLQNALDACEPDTGVVTLACHYDELDQGVRVSVTDNGVGISQAAQRELFQPFRSTKGYGGTGLGLVVTKKIVEEHGGHVDVQSQPDQGTTFTIFLPTESEREPAATHSPY